MGKPPELYAAALTWHSMSFFLMGCTLHDRNMNMRMSIRRASIFIFIFIFPERVPMELRIHQHSIQSQLQQSRLSLLCITAPRILRVVRRVKSHRQCRAL